MSKTGFSFLKKGFSRLPGLSLSNTKAFYSFKSSKWNNLQSDERHPKIKGSLESMLLPAELKRCSWPPGQQHSALVAASLTLGKFALSMLFMPLPHQGPALQWWVSDSQNSLSSTTPHSLRPVAADWEYLQCLQYSASTQLNSKWTARHPTPTVGAIFNVGKTQLHSRGSWRSVPSRSIPVHSLPVRDGVCYLDQALDSCISHICRASCSAVSCASGYKP